MWQNSNFLSLLLFLAFNFPAWSVNSQGIKRSVLNDSEALLLAVKTGAPVHELTQALATTKPLELEVALATDRQKKVFWINIYNAYFQILAKQGASAPNIYTDKLFTIAHTPLSLDDIGNGILRRYPAKWSLGYLPKLFVGKNIRKWAVAKVDRRVHFALNCGARSCPPIAFYTVERIEQQLDTATRSFLKSETTVNIEKKEVVTSQLLSWYQHDFKGRRGTMRLLSDVLEKDLKGYTLSYSEYDWSQQLGNFSP